MVISREGLRWGEGGVGGKGNAVRSHGSRDCPYSMLVLTQATGGWERTMTARYVLHPWCYDDVAVGTCGAMMMYMNGKKS